MDPDQVPQVPTGRTQRSDVVRWLTADQPELVNSDPYGEGWMIRIRIEDAAQIESLMTAEQYDAYVGQESEG